MIKRFLRLVLIIAIFFLFGSSFQNDLFLSTTDSLNDGLIFKNFSDPWGRFYLKIPAAWTYDTNPYETYLSWYEINNLQPNEPIPMYINDGVKFAVATMDNSGNLSVKSWQGKNRAEHMLPTDNDTVSIKNVFYEREISYDSGSNINAISIYIPADKKIFILSLYPNGPNRDKYINIFNQIVESFKVL